MPPSRIRDPAQAFAWRHPSSMWSTLWCFPSSSSTYLWLWSSSPSKSKGTRPWQSVAWRKMRWDDSGKWHFFLVFIPESNTPKRAPHPHPHYQHLLLRMFVSCITKVFFIRNQSTCWSTFYFSSRQFTSNAMYNFLQQNKALKTASLHLHFTETVHTSFCL